LQPPARGSRISAARAIEPKSKSSPTNSRRINAAKNGVPKRPLVLYLVLVAALLPLVFQIMRGESNTQERFVRTLTSHPEIADRLESLESEDELFALLPEGRIEGAHLARETWNHWGYALFAAVLFIGAIWPSLDRDKTALLQWIAVAAITSTIGIVSLIMFQWIAEFSQGFNLRGRSIIVVLFYIVKFIGFSYRAALD